MLKVVFSTVLLPSFLFVGFLPCLVLEGKLSPSGSPLLLIILFVAILKYKIYFKCEIHDFLCYDLFSGYNDVLKLVL